MRFVFNFPDLGEGLEEGTILEWYVKEGDKVKVGDPWCRWKPIRW